MRRLDVARSPAQLGKATRLKMYARPLRPARAPFYVQHATPECFMVGWWWQPAGAERPEPLGAQYDLAAARILSLVDDARAGAA